MPKPSVIFCNLQNSGASAIDPILREILAHAGYCMTPYGPEATGRLAGDLAAGTVTLPFYHWTHDPVETFAGMIGEPQYRFVYLHRDPRDAAVSWAHDFQRSGVCGDASFEQILEMVVTHNQPQHVKAAARWVKSDCMAITFESMKADTGATIRSILQYAGYFDLDPSDRMSDMQLNEVIEKHSFATVSGRARGETGEIVRSQYMLRKGISGEWKQHFSPQLIKQCEEMIGEEIALLGYERSPDLHRPYSQRSARFAQVVSPPFACGVAWLVNALLHLDVKLTNRSFEPGHWLSASGGEFMSERAEEHLKWHLPALHEKKEFQFAEDLEILWEHRLDFVNEGSAPTILFVRDPRDAVYSMYRRNIAPAMSFPCYLARPDEWPDHFPGLFQLPPIETFAYFSWFWLAMGELMPVKLVRFEDVKSQPHECLKAVLDFLNIERSAEALEAAIASSSFDSARKAMETMEVETGRAFKTVRSAQLAEWRRSYSLLARLLVRRIGATVIGHLGYGPDRGEKTKAELFSPWEARVKKIRNARLRALSIKWVEETEGGNVPSLRSLGEDILQARLKGKDVLRAAAVAGAIHYTRCIFADTSSSHARMALRVFLNANLTFFGQWSVQVAARFSLNRIAAASSPKVLKRLGVWQRRKSDFLMRLPAILEEHA